MDGPRVLQTCMRLASRKPIAQSAGAIRRPFSQLQTALAASQAPRSRARLSAQLSQVCHFSNGRVIQGEATTKPEDAGTPAPEGKEAPKEDAVVAELEAKKKEALDLTDKWKRSIADYRNLQEQTKREVQKAKDFALERFARDLIDSVDNLDRALGTVDPKTIDASSPPSTATDTASGSGTSEAASVRKDLKNLYEGLRMTERILLSTLKKHGLERFDPAAPDAIAEGESAVRFDPNRHEATFQAPQEGKEDGTVFYCQSKGFALNGRVLRAAKVGVVKNS